MVSASSRRKKITEKNPGEGLVQNGEEGNAPVVAVSEFVILLFPEGRMKL